MDETSLPSLVYRQVTGYGFDRRRAGADGTPPHVPTDVASAVPRANHARPRIIASGNRPQYKRVWRGGRGSVDGSMTSLRD